MLLDMSVQKVALRPLHLDDREPVGANLDALLEKLKIDIIGQVDLAKMFGDRKSTRLNSSHGYISYAVFCLKKKKKKVNIKRLIIRSTRVPLHAEVSTYSRTDERSTLKHSYCLPAEHFRPTALCACRQVPLN